MLMRFQLQFLRTIYNAEVVVVLLGGCSVEALMSDDLILVRWMMAKSFLKIGESI